MITIGLTGSVGMGKTTVSNMFRQKGIHVHDSDAAVHALMAPGGKAVGAVAKLFPTADVGGFIDRQVLGRIVFADAAKMKQLEDIIHPLVRAESDAFKAEMQNRAQDFCVLDIPLLFETNAETRVDVTVVVSAPPEVQRERVLSRPGMTAERFDFILESQMSDTEKRKRASYVIENGGDLEDTEAQLDKILETLRAKP